MANRVKIKWNKTAFQEALNSNEVKGELMRRARRIARAAGEGFEARQFPGDYGGSPRPIGQVAATTFEARLAEANDKALTRAIDSGR